MWGGQDVSELSHTPLSQAQRKGGTKALRESQEQRREEGDRETLGRAGQSTAEQENREGGKVWDILNDRQG